MWGARREEGWGGGASGGEGYAWDERCSAAQVTLVVDIGLARLL